MSTDKTLAAKAARFSLIGLAGVTLAIAAVLSGCNKKEPVTPAKPSVSSEVKADAQKVVDEAKEAAKDAKDAVEEAGKKVGDEAKEAGEKIEAGAKKAAEATKDAVN